MSTLENRICWPSRRLSEVARVVTGKTPITSNREYYGGTIPFVTPVDLKSQSINSAVTLLSDSGANTVSRVPAGTVMVSCIGSLGKVGIAEREVCTNQQINSLIFDTSQVEPRYGFHFCRTLKPQLEAMAPSTTIPIVNKSRFSELSIPLPPLPEQRRIAAILDKVDILCAMRHEAITKLEQLLQSVFYEMFGHCSEVIKTVAELATAEGAVRTGPFGSQLLHSEFVESGIAVLGIDNAVSNEFSWAKPRFITEQKYATLSRYRVYPGDVLITIMGTCGRCAVVPAEIPVSINTKHLCCISLDREKCEPEFLHSYFLMHPIARAYLASRAKGAIMSGLNMGIIKELPVALPPIERQRQYVSIKMELQRQAARNMSYAVKSNALFGALQQQAFSGKI